MAHRSHHQDKAHSHLSDAAGHPDDIPVRLRAEEKARILENRGMQALSPEQIQQTLHELHVHQIELEMQNEQLRQTQAQLEASRARYLDLYDLAPVGYVTTSEKGLILEANLTAAGMLDMPRTRLMNQPLSRFILPEDQPIYYKNRKMLFETDQKQVCELRMLNRKAAASWVRLETVPARDRGTGHRVCRAVVVDLAERKRAEEALVAANLQLEVSHQGLKETRQQLEASDRQLQQAQKMESVGRLAGGVAHDFNNMLSVIFGYAELAMTKVQPDDSLHADLEQIIDAARRSAQITRQLLAFARKQAIRPIVIDINETVERTLGMLRRLIGEDINLKWTPGTGLRPIKIDPAQLDQILANLCVNARDAIADVGMISIASQSVTFDEIYCVDHPEFFQDDYVLLSVSDDGCGMDKETLDNIFEPFFTTKPAGQGTGLGLATVYGIVKQNNGCINVYSEQGQGTTFRIYLPCHKGPADGVVEAKSAPISLGRGETVLVVEDDAVILELTEKILQKYGYSVLAARTAKEALSLAQKRAGRIQLLITDVIMPKMNGRELAERAQSISPNLKTLFMSGYTADIIAYRGVLDEDLHFIQKPFSGQALAAAVRKVLDSE